MLVMRNRDVPGVIGRVGTILGDHGINISRFHLGRRERGGEAMAVIEVDAAADAETLNALRSLQEILSVQVIELV
jgi:D-3-phosphoglycerate dehydrogenase